MKRNKVKEYYIKQAKEYGLSKQSTMRDINIREMEVEKIINCVSSLKKYFGPYPKILEVGCGNGYTSEMIEKKLGLNLVAIDFCEDFIKIAKKRNLKNVEFKIGDILDLEFDENSFDIVFTKRCLINLESWGQQQKALDEIYRVVKSNGCFLMIEAFTDGLENLNEARENVGLEPIPQPRHNVFLNKKEFLKFITGKFEQFYIKMPVFPFKNCENFLSTYYFGSKVLYPALILNQKELIYNSKFVEFFRYLPPYGNYSYVQMFVLRKI